MWQRWIAASITFLGCDRGLVYSGWCSHGGLVTNHNVTPLWCDNYHSMVSHMAPGSPLTGGWMVGIVSVT